jgi:hypothetical protein
MLLVRYLSHVQIVSSFSSHPLLQWKGNYCTRSIHEWSIHCLVFILDTCLISSVLLLEEVRYRALLRSLLFYVIVNMSSTFSFSLILDLVTTFYYCFYWIQWNGQGHLFPSRISFSYCASHLLTNHLINQSVRSDSQSIYEFDSSILFSASPAATASILDMESPSRKKLGDVVWSYYTILILHRINHSYPRYMSIYFSRTGSISIKLSSCTIQLAFCTIIC